MSFWNLNDGESATNTDGTFESGGGDLEPIPNKTGCIAAIEEAKWDDYEGDEYISLKWQIAKPSEYQNRVVFQKIRVMDRDPKKADKAKRMLAAIDANAGGKLSKLTGKPSDTDLMSALMGKMMAIKVMVWRIEKDDNGNPLPADEVKKGNWISAVSPAKSKQKHPDPEPHPAPQNNVDDYDDDIPF